VEQAAGGVLEVIAAGIDLPGLGLAHAPQLDEAVVAGGNDQRHGRVESDPVDTTVVALEDELDDGVSVTEHVGLVLVRASDLVFEGH
jgi:hypothetical protein